MRPQEAAQRRGEEQGGERRRGGQPHEAGQPAGRAVQPPQQAGDLVLHPLRRAQHLLAERGGGEALRAALEERGTEVALEAVQPPGDGGVVDPERPRRGRERPTPPQRQHHPQPVPVAQRPLRCVFPRSHCAISRMFCAGVHGHSRVPTPRGGPDAWRTDPVRGAAVLPRVGPDRG
jgi:hypothetical protein